MKHDILRRRKAIVEATGCDLKDVHKYKSCSVCTFKVKGKVYYAFIADFNRVGRNTLGQNLGKFQIDGALVTVYSSLA